MLNSHICLICNFQILRVLSETAVAVRTKAMKCLTAVVESDPGILARVSTIHKQRPVVYNIITMYM